MLKTWEAPKIVVEEFIPNEYVSACGDSGTFYKFKCNAGSEYTSYNVFFNGDDGKAGTADDVAWTTSGRYSPVHKNGSYSPCGTTHEASKNDDFIKGYMYAQGLTGRNYGSRIDVIVWTDGGTNTHCTQNLNITDWETAKS